MNLALLNDFGIDAKDGLARCMNDQELYCKLLSMFLEDQAFSIALSAYERGDFDAMFSSLHDLKGTSGNIGITELYRTVTPLVELLRNHNPAGADIAEPVAKAQAAYEAACAGIRQALAET